MVTTKNFGKVALFGGSQTRPNKPRGWTSQDIADLYRIGDQLRQFGFPVVVHTGQSDEGDPWAVFERDGTDEVVVHVALIDSELVIVDVVRDRTHRGSDLGSLAEKLLAEAPLTLPRVEDRGNVVLHPRMVMTAFVAAAFVLSEFANPATAEVGGFENDPGGVPQAKGRTAALPAQQAVDCTGKIAGRDGLGGMHAAQAIATGGLAASFAALSEHLVWGVTINHVEELRDTEQETAGLFGAVVHAQLAAPLLFDDVLLSGDHRADAWYLARASTTPSEAGLKAGAHVRINVGVDDVNDEMIVLVAPTSSAGASLQVEEEDTLKTDSVTFEFSSNGQDFRFVAVLDQPDATSAAESDRPSIKTSEAFDRVVASVSVLDQSQLPTFSFDGNAEGAIVIRTAASADSMIDASELIGSFPTSSPEADMQVDAPSASFEAYRLISELSQNVHLTPEVANVLVYAGGDVRVSGFVFGRDSIVFIENVTPPDWLASVEIVGSDVVLVGHVGSVTLFDAVGTLF